MLFIRLESLCIPKTFNMAGSRCFLFRGVGRGAEGKG